MTYTIIEDDLELKEFLSIAMLTYNHEKFISEAIESVLLQKTNFNYKIVIAEDFSTDKTRDIVISYQKKYPDKIRLLLQDKNVGANENNKILFKNLKGKYIAALEGDDYWTDPLKLQKQVDFLENNLEFSFCHSDVHTLNLDYTINNNHNFKSWNYLNNISDYRLAIFYPTAFTCTCVFRNIIQSNKLSKKIVSGDWMLFVLLTLNGKAKFINEKQAIYRLNTGVSVYTVWHKNFHIQSLFLLKQVNPLLTLNKNIWLIKGAIYHILIKFSKDFNSKLLYKIGNKLKYKV